MTLSEQKTLLSSFNNHGFNLADIFNLAHEAIILIDAAHNIILLNDSAESILGYAEQDVLGKPLNTLISVGELAQQKTGTKFGESPVTFKLMAQQTPVHLNRKNGEPFPAELSISNLDEQGKIYAVVVKDISKRTQAQIERDNLVTQLRALDDAARAINAELSLHQVLQTIAERTQALIDVEIAALGIHDGESHFSRFITSGIDPDIASELESSAYIRKLLGPLFYNGQSVMLNKVSPPSPSDRLRPEAPAIHRLLGVPIAAKGTLIGTLYLANKKSGGGFTQNDKRLLERIAVHAAIAIENARAYEKTQRLAILEERERFARDLHDGIIQSIYGVGLMLDQAKADIPDDHQEARTQIDTVLGNLAVVIQDLRNYIFDLRPQAIRQIGLVARFNGLIKEVRANTKLPIEASVEEGIDSFLSEEQTEHLFHIGHEALSNAIRHAKASYIKVSLTHKDTIVTLKVDDDGKGFVMPSHVKPGHRGLANMRSRAFQIGARMEIQSIPNKGTQVTVQVKGRGRN